MLFASTGAQILAIDISKNLIALAVQRLAAFPNVRFEVSAFETFSPNTTYDLIYSAQAFHWVPTAVGLPHAARLLKPGGYLALFWNFFRYDADATLLQIRECITRHIALFARYPEGSAFEFDSFKTLWIDELNQSALFKNVTAEIVQMTRTCTMDEYLALVSSYSWFQTQSETIQQDLVTELRDSFEVKMPQLPFIIQTLLIYAQNVKNI